MSLTEAEQFLLDCSSEGRDGAKRFCMSKLTVADFKDKINTPEGSCHSHEFFIARLDEINALDSRLRKLTPAWADSTKARRALEKIHSTLGGIGSSTRLWREMESEMRARA
jgi:hypothetical protein